MNNIYFLLCCLVFITFSTLAEEVVNDVCSEYSRASGDPDIYSTLSDEIPYQKGLLWKIENTSGDISYLFGTMHSQDQLITRLPPPVRLALAQSRSLVMEVIPDQKANRIFVDSIFFPEQNKLRDLLDPLVFSRLQTRIIEYGIDKEDVARIKPWAAFTLIGRPLPIRAPTLDEVLMQKAASLDKLIFGLETMNEIITVLENISMEDQIEILNDTVCNHAQIISDSQKLLQLYLQRDLAGIAKFNKQPHHYEATFDRLMQSVVYNRNSRMLERMEGFLSNGKAFIAVGATHLPGDRGLLNSLEIKGYKVSVIF